MSDRGFSGGPGQEVVERTFRMKFVDGGIACNYVQVGGREVSIAAFKPTFGKRRTFHDRRRNRCRQTQNMGITVDRNAVQGKEIVPNIAAVDIHGGRSVCSGGYTRQPLRPPDRVSFAHRRDNPSEHIGASLQLIDGTHNAPGIRLHRRAKRVGPGCFLGLGGPGQEQGEQG